MRYLSLRDRCIAASTLAPSPNLRAWNSNPPSSSTQLDLIFLTPSETAHIYGGVASPRQQSEQNPGQNPGQTSGMPAKQAQSQVSPIPTVPPPTRPISQPHAWSDALQTVLDQPAANLPTRLFLGGMVFSALFAAWAWFGQIQEVSHAQGRLAPAGAVYKVQPSTQAELAQIWVQEGQSIKKGQVLAELDTRLALMEIEGLEQALNGYRLQLLQTHSLMERTRLEAQTRQAIAQAETQAQQATILQANTDVATNQDMLAQLEDEIHAYQTRLERLTPLVQEGVLAQDQLFEVEQSLRERQQSNTQVQGKLEQSLAQVKQLQAGLNQKQAEGEKSGLEIRQQLQKLELEVSQLEAKIAETETLLKSAQTRLGQMFLYAPVDGLVSSLNVDHRGEMVQAGQTIAEIAPADSPLVLSAALPSREAGLVQVGMPVQMKFDAFPYQIYGMISGTVLSISPDAKIDETLGSIYEVKIELAPIQPHAHRPSINLKAGQTATAEIVVRRRRVIDILMEPIHKLQTSGISL